MKNGEVQLVFNTTEGAQAIADSFTLRAAALLGNIPYYTTVAGARAAVEAIAALRQGGLEVAPLQSYFSAIVLVAPGRPHAPDGVLLAEADSLSRSDFCDG